MQNSSEILSKQKSDAPENISYPSQAQKTLCPCKAQADIWQPSPTSPCGVLAGNSSCMPSFPSWKCDTLECQFSQVISPVIFLQWCILFDAIFKIPVFSRVCHFPIISQSLHQRHELCTAQQNPHAFLKVNYVMILFFQNELFRPPANKQEYGLG